MGALKYDVEFLASHHIIDYSLLVGVDWEGRALVVGIIDFIRTFTWDKYWESKIKASVGSGYIWLSKVQLFFSVIFAILPLFYRVQNWVGASQPLNKQNPKLEKIILVNPN